MRFLMTVARPADKQTPSDEFLLAQLLQQVAHHVMNDRTEGTLRDADGNQVGHFELRKDDLT